MKKTILNVLLTCGIVNCYAQTEQVSWSFSAKKVALNEYLIEFKAVINSGWHIYAQRQPEGSNVLPTSVKFTANPLILLIGPVKEKGNMILEDVPGLNVSQNEYAENVSFLQRVKLKAKIKTNVSGSVQYMACTDVMCLPPQTVKFNIPLQ